jgi:putative membrane protein
MQRTRHGEHDQGDTQMMYGYGSGLGLGGWLGMLGMLVLVVGVVLLVAWLVGRGGRVAPAQGSQGLAGQPAGRDALELLRMRFARGEISEAEYRSARQVLEEGR